MTDACLSHRPGPALRAASSQRGSVLVWAAFVILMVLGVIASGVSSDKAHDALASAELAGGGQARAVAEAGLVDGFAWFRRQQVQPVSAFLPRRDLAASPPVNETDDPALGLVREYEITPSLWGRYELRLTTPAEPFTDADGDGRYDAGEPYTDTDGNGRRDGVRGVRDVTAGRGLPGTGTVWLIESRGYLYNRPRGDLPLSTPPNGLRASATVASEVRRMTIVPPAAAAICAFTGSAITVGTRGRVTGGAGGAGLAYSTASGSPATSGGEVTGSPSSTAVPGYSGTLESVFGVGASELKSMADVSTASMSSVPSPVGAYTLTVIDGDATFTSTQPLRGTGIVIVLGSCTIQSGSNSWFSGLLWVQGALTVRAPCYLRGTLLAGGAVDVRGTGGDTAEVEHDAQILNDLLFLMGQYRHSKAVFVPGDDPGAVAAGG